MPFFILYHILFILSSLLKLTFGKRFIDPGPARSPEKISYGTRSDDTEFSDHFREKVRSYNLLEVAKNSHIGDL